VGTIYRRSGTRYLWLKWRDAEGKEWRRSSETESEDEARALLAEIEKQERGAGRAVSGGVTAQAFYDETWLPLRRRTFPNSWRTDRNVMENHFLVDFGHRFMAELASDQGEVELLDWVIGLRERASSRDQTPLASRTIRNVANSTRVFFADALERKIVSRNPTAGWKNGKHLPDIEDKDAGWRRNAGFDLSEVVAITSDPRIPEDRRALYRLRFLGGPRPGESSNARWRDLDRTTRPLWRLTLDSSWSSQAKREKGTKTGAELNIPVHPALQAAFESWWTEGWARFMGRSPTPDDLIFPRQDGRQRDTATTGHQFKADLEVLGIPHQRQYESRATFRNLALRAGASEFHVNLISHPKPRKGADFYTRLEMQWEQMCLAVLAIDPSRWAGTGQGTGEGTVGEGTKDKAPEPFGSGASVLAGPRGFEPLAFGFVVRRSIQLS